MDEPVYQSIRTEFITGPAGTGKTFEVKRRVAEDPKYGQVCATTGIAAVNLGTITLNSMIGYFDTESLRDLYVTGRLSQKLKGLAEERRNLIIDEVSMMDAGQLDIFYQAIRGINEGGYDYGLVLAGDFCQLAPVKATWAFRAECWPDFAASTTRLSKIWRQDNPRFLEALNLARAGQGPECVEVLKELGVEFAPALDGRFDGTTIIPKNDGVDRFNMVALQRLATSALVLKAKRWGRQRPEWRLIPDVLRSKMGALVMILANDNAGWAYANGDLGHIETAENGLLGVRMVRTGGLSLIGPIERLALQDDNPPGMEKPRGLAAACRMETEARQMEAPFYVPESRKWAVGGIKYYPVRLGYACTVHKTQGLTLDKIQVDCRNHFFSEPSMAYVGMSRVRSPQGLRIVGTPELLAGRIKTSPEVQEWI